MSESRPIVRAGMTLVEVTVALGVGSLALALGLHLYVQTQRVIDRQQVKAARLGAETDLLALLRRDIRLAAAIAPESTAERLVLVARDGSRTRYNATPKGTQRAARPDDPPGAPQALGVRAAFSYPPGGRLVRVSWREAGVSQSLTLCLRNGGAL
jgi:type II secretory pathway component PulJ